jgi:hypothetical protein
VRSEGARAQPCVRGRGARRETYHKSALALPPVSERLPCSPATLALPAPPRVNLRAPPESQLVRCGVGVREHAKSCGDFSTGTVRDCAAKPSRPQTQFYLRRPAATC